LDIACSSSNIGAVNLSISGGTGFYNFQWSNGATSQNISGLSAGNYNVTISDANNCLSFASATVNSTPGLQVIASSTNLSCNGANDGCVQVSVNGGTAPYDYLWSNGATVDSICGLAVGTYTIIVTDNGTTNCLGTDTIVISAPPALVSNTVNVTNESCITLGSINISVSGGTTPYSYIWNNAATSEDVSGLAAGSYSVTIIDANSCIYIENINIDTPLTPQLSAFIGQAGVSDSTIVIGDIIAVNAGADQSAQGVSYSWSSVPASANFENDTSFATNVSPDPAGFYSLVITATSADGCVVTDTLSLTVNPTLAPKIPNAFSPNNDGINDIFRLVDLNVQYLKEFKVYNRWGKLLYDNLEGSWDGTFNGIEQPREAYLYIISWQLPSDPNPTLIRGTVTLLR
jgi:gliding motility-associated-like protein